MLDWSPKPRASHGRWPSGSSPVPPSEGSVCRPLARLCPCGPDSSTTAVNEPPTITTTSGTAFTYRENGTGALATYRATDPERETIPWNLSGLDSGDFTISDTGVLTFNTPPGHEHPSDSGGDNVYEVTVEATDFASNTATLAVTITVTNLTD